MVFCIPFHIAFPLSSDFYIVFKWNSISPLILTDLMLQVLAFQKEYFQLNQCKIRICSIYLVVGLGLMVSKKKLQCGNSL